MRSTMLYELLDYSAYGVSNYCESCLASDVNYHFREATKMVASSLDWNSSLNSCFEGFPGFDS